MAYFKAKNAPQSISAGAPPQTPMGELTALPRPPSWIWGPTSKGRGGGEGRGGEHETLTVNMEGKHEHPQHKFLVAPLILSKRTHISSYSFHRL